MSKAQVVLTKNNIYRCYSVPLMRFLKERGHRFFDAVRNPSNYSLMFQFQITSKLENDLKAWSAMKSVDKLPYRRDMKHK